jgi:L-2-hydroxyglutarate oxidase LhgO
MYDAVIIGAGISGASLARELCRYKLRIAVLEKGNDVCAGASKSNSATVHSGHDATFGTKKHYTMFWEMPCTNVFAPSLAFLSFGTE